MLFHTNIIVLYAEEDISGEFLKMRSKLTRLIPNKLYRFKTVGSLKLILAGGSFEIEPSEKGSIFTTTHDWRRTKFEKDFREIKKEKKTIKKIITW